jgi:hypothetical protein
MNVTTQDDPNQEPLWAEILPGDSQLRVPQFGILHLLIWTALAAVLLKYNQAVHTLDTGLRDPFMNSRVMTIQWVVTVILTASTMVGLGALIRARRSGRTGRFQPGHWLVVVSLVNGILALAVEPLYCVRSYSAGTAGLFSGALVAERAIIAILYTCAAVRLRDAWRWRALFLAYAVVTWLWTVADTTFFLATILPATNPSVYWGRCLSGLGITLAGRIAILSCLVVATLGDLLGRTSRDWVHWLGVVVAWLGWCMNVLTLVYIRFLYN